MFYFCNVLNLAVKPRLGFFDVSRVENSPESQNPVTPLPINFPRFICHRINKTRAASLRGPANSASVASLVGGRAHLPGVCIQNYGYCWSHSLLLQMDLSLKSIVEFPVPLCSV